MKRNVENVATGPATVPVRTSIMLKLDGTARQLDVAPWTTLLDALREHLDLTVREGPRSRLLRVRAGLGRRGAGAPAWRSRKKAFSITPSAAS